MLHNLGSNRADNFKMASQYTNPILRLLSTWLPTELCSTWTTYATSTEFMQID